MDETKVYYKQNVYVEVEDMNVTTKWSDLIKFDAAWEKYKT